MVLAKRAEGWRGVSCPLNFCLNLSVAVKGYHDQGKEFVGGLEFQKVGVHGHHGREHGSRQEGMVLEQ